MSKMKKRLVGVAGGLVLLAAAVDRAGRERQRAGGPASRQ